MLCNDHIFQTEEISILILIVPDNPYDNSHFFILSFTLKCCSRRIYNQMPVVLFKTWNTNTKYLYLHVYLNMNVHIFIV